MKYLGFFILSFLIGLVVTFGYVMLRASHSQQKSNVQKPNPTSSFSIESPPLESLKGSIASRSGTLLWESRIATEPSELKDNRELKQGEQLITQDKSNVTVNFNQVGEIFLAENTVLSFIQTRPIDFVVEQKKGVVTYTVNGSTPISVRIRNALITKTSGIMQITIREGDSVIVISTIKGTAQIGFNDLDLISRVFTLREGQIYEYNSDERTTINSKNK
jgi:hypothetical protein